MKKKPILVLCILGIFSSLYSQKDKVNEIEEVVVTATRTERRLKDVPITTTVISSQMIQKSQVSNFKDFLERELAGVSFSNHGNSPAINMLGLDAKYLLFLVDGERMAGETFDNIDYNRINLDDIERIEIVKGASSSLYGSNAIGGVINIITKKPKKDIETSLSARYGTFNEKIGNIFLGTKQKWGAVSLSASYKTREPYLLRDKTPLVKTFANELKDAEKLNEYYIAGYYDYGVNPKLSLLLNSKIKLDISTGFYFRERNQGGEEAKKLREQYSDYANSAKLNIQLSDNKNINISGSYGIYEKFENYLLLKSKEKKYENSIWRASVIYDQKMWDKHSLVLGGEFLSEELLSFMFSSANSKKNAQTYAIFTQQEWALSQGLTLVSGLRYDYHSEFEGEFTWRFSGMYKMGGNVTLRGGYSGGFRSPNLKELYTDWYHPNGGGFQIIGNTDLKVEKSHNFTLSSDMDWGKLNITAIGQYSQIKDKITPIWTNSSMDVLRYTKLQEANILSAEVLATYKFAEEFLIKGSYAFTRDFNEERQLTRPHTLTARLEYSPNLFGKYTPMISFSGKYVSGVDIYNEDITRGKYRVYYGPYSIWRLGMYLDLPFSLQVSTGIDNLFNYQPQFVGSHSSISSGRTYFIGVKWNLR